jgi:hypothetical protein
MARRGENVRDWQSQPDQLVNDHRAQPFNRSIAKKLTQQSA